MTPEEQSLDRWRDELYDLPAEARQRRLAELAAKDPHAASRLDSELRAHEGFRNADSDQLRALDLFHRPDWNGTVIGGRYHIQAQLGQGGFARVFSATQTAVRGREVVVKILKPGIAGAADRELQALTSLPRDPGLVQVIDAGTHEGLSFIVMERLHGTTLEHRIVKAPFRWDDALSILERIAGSLSVLHANRILHRDVKPHNIILTERGRRPVLIDFGIAHVSQSSVTYPIPAGTLRYMAPEVLQSGAVSERSEVYSLAVVLTDMLRGNCGDPVADSARPERLRSIGVPANAVEAIVKALGPAECRQGSVSSFVAELQSQPVALSRRWLLTGIALPAAAAAGVLIHRQSAVWSQHSIAFREPSSILLRIHKRHYFYLFSGLDQPGGDPMFLGPAPSPGPLQPGDYTVSVRDGEELHLLWNASVLPLFGMLVPGTAVPPELVENTRKVVSRYARSELRLSSRHMPLPASGLHSAKLIFPTA